MDKKILQDRQEKILELIREFCSKHLDEDYFELSERMVKKLGRKRNPPIVSGQPQIWAAAIIHALGTINFLFDKSFKPYVSVDEINGFFSTSKSTVSGKSKLIRDMLKLGYYDNEFSTKHMNENNPYTNMVMVDGFIVHVSSLPEKYQEMVRQARAEGKDISFETK